MKQHVTFMQVSPNDVELGKAYKIEKVGGIGMPIRTKTGAPLVLQMTSPEPSGKHTKIIAHSGVFPLHELSPKDSTKRTLDLTTTDVRCQNFLNELHQRLKAFLLTRKDEVLQLEPKLFKSGEKYLEDIKEWEPFLKMDAINGPTFRTRVEIGDKDKDQKTKIVVCVGNTAVAGDHDSVTKGSEVVPVVHISGINLLKSGIFINMKVVEMLVWPLDNNLDNMMKRFNTCQSDMGPIAPTPPPEAAAPPPPVVSPSQASGDTQPLENEQQEEEEEVSEEDEISEEAESPTSRKRKAEIPAEPQSAAKRKQK